MEQKSDHQIVEVVEAVGSGHAGSLSAPSAEVMDRIANSVDSVIAAGGSRRIISCLPRTTNGRPMIVSGNNIIDYNPVPIPTSTSTALTANNTSVIMLPKPAANPGRQILTQVRGVSNNQRIIYIQQPHQTRQQQHQVTDHYGLSESPKMLLEPLTTLERVGVAYEEEVVTTTYVNDTDGDDCKSFGAGHILTPSTSSLINNNDDHNSGQILLASFSNPNNVNDHQYNNGQQQSSFQTTTISTPLTSSSNNNNFIIPTSSSQILNGELIEDGHHLSDHDHQQNIVVSSSEEMMVDVTADGGDNNNIIDHHQIDNSSYQLEPNLPPGSLVKVEVVVEEGSGVSQAEAEEAAKHLRVLTTSANGNIVAHVAGVNGSSSIDGNEWVPQQPSAVDFQQQQQQPSSTSTTIIHNDHCNNRQSTINHHRYINSSNDNNDNNNASGVSDSVDETVNSVVNSLISMEPLHFDSSSPSPQDDNPLLHSSSLSLYNNNHSLLNHSTSFNNSPLPSPAAKSNGIKKQPRKRRQRLDNEEKRFRCNFCDKTFTARSSLDVHSRIHTGERPYKCPECGKTFRHCGHLTCHVRTHTGERPYVCRVCGKGFTQSTPCRRHEASQHNLSP